MEDIIAEDKDCGRDKKGQNPRHAKSQDHYLSLYAHTQHFGHETQTGESEKRRDDNKTSFGQPPSLTFPHLNTCKNNSPSTGLDASFESHTTDINVFE